MEEATNTRWGEEEPRTHIRGSLPIDGVYHTKDLEVTSTVQLSFHESVGDHRNVIADISTRSDPKLETWDLKSFSRRQGD